MASSSRFRYDVFISFRGEDTRDNFTSHLHAALCRKRIATFIDNELNRGDEISSALLKAIEESKLSVIVFSNNYAASRWCLDELLHILRCKQVSGHIVVPVFYRVDPSVVRKQVGSFGDAFARHEKYGDKANQWKEALTEAANLSGWDSSVTRPESRLVDEIVKDILNKLTRMSVNCSEGLIGMDSRVAELKSLLRIGSPEVRALGIWGMGGIGKTTTAQVLFNEISHEFENSCFLVNFRREMEKCDGLSGLRQKLLCELLEDGAVWRGTRAVEYGYDRERLRRAKVLIVVDDVNDSNSFENVVGGHDRFGPGSRIIVTSRDNKVLKNCGVDEVYLVGELGEEEALQLFCRYAFKQSHPAEDYRKLSKTVIDYAKGNPLALIVLGSALYTMSMRYWEDRLKKLKQVPEPGIQNLLTISYDGLDVEEKNIFLDIACFFNGDSVDHVIDLLASSYCSVYSGIQDLIDKSLLTVSNNELGMHDLLQEMGRNIVRGEAKEPGKRSRLWTPEEVYRLLAHNTVRVGNIYDIRLLFFLSGGVAVRFEGTEAVEGIFLDVSRVKKVSLCSTVFTRMHNLRLLKFECLHNQEEQKLLLPRQGLESLPSELRYLYWSRFPSKSLPQNFSPENLVELNMQSSSIEKLWDGIQDLANLKKIDLSSSKNLSRIPDLSRATSLEDLFLGYTKVRDLPKLPAHVKSLMLQGTPIKGMVESIQCLEKLVYLNLTECKRLKTLPPTISQLDSLTILNLGGCSNFTELPELPQKLKSLNVEGTAVEQLPLSIGHLPELSKLGIQDCKKLRRLPTTITELKCLQSLVLSGCTQLQSFPENLEMMGFLSTLNLRGTAIKELPSQVKHLVGLKLLDLADCKFLTHLPNTLCDLTSLKFLTLNKCQNVNELPPNLGNLSSLSRLEACGTSIQQLPPSIRELSKLKALHLSSCQRLMSLPELPPKLEVVDVHSCLMLQRVPVWLLFDSQENISCDFSNCFKLDPVSHCSILASAQVNVKLMASRSMEESDEIFAIDTPSTACCLPASDVWEWFIHQSSGSSTTINLPQGWCNRNFIGFALCVVIESENSHSEESFNIRSRCTFKINQGSVDFDTSTLWSWDPNKHKNIRSSHEFILYDHDMFVKVSEADLGGNKAEASFEFHVENHRCQALPCCKVKKCGVRLLYKDTDSGGQVVEDHGGKKRCRGEEQCSCCFKSEGVEPCADWSSAVDKRECDCGLNPNKKRYNREP